MDYTITIAHTHTHRGRCHLGKVVLYAISVDFHSELGTLLVPWAQVLATEQLQRGGGLEGDSLLILTSTNKQYSYSSYTEWKF